jgi:hypothetical protein
MVQDGFHPQSLFSSGEGEVITQKALAPADLDRVRDLYLRFTGLPQNMRQHLRVPLGRLNRALRRIDVTNFAIELGIALEALLLNDLDDDRGELTFRLRTRGARLLGETFEERVLTSRILRDVYKLRSIAVHTGTIPADAVSTPIGEVLQSGCELAARAIERMMEGGSPDWERIMLSRSLAAHPESPWSAPRIPSEQRWIPKALARDSSGALGSSSLALSSA